MENNFFITSPTTEGYLKGEGSPISRRIGSWILDIFMWFMVFLSLYFAYDNRPKLWTQMSFPLEYMPNARIIIFLLISLYIMGAYSRFVAINLEQNGKMEVFNIVFIILRYLERDRFNAKYMKSSVSYVSWCAITSWNYSNYVV